MKTSKSEQMSPGLSLGCRHEGIWTSAWSERGRGVREAIVRELKAETLLMVDHIFSFRTAGGEGKMDPWPARHHFSESQSCRQEPAEDRGHPAIHQHLVNAEDRSDSKSSTAGQSEHRTVSSQNGSGFPAQGSWFRAPGSWFRAPGSWFRAPGSPQEMLLPLQFQLKVFRAAR